MAVAKKGTTKTTLKANSKTLEELKAVEVVEVVEEAVVLNTTPMEIPRQKQQINRDELVPCKSTRKNLIYVSTRTTEKFEWMNYGDTHYITLGELIVMKSTQPRFLTEGWMIVDDEDAIEQLGLSKMYGSIFEVDDMETFFASSEQEIERILTNMPRGFKNTIGSFAREYIESGQLDSNRKIKLLEQLLDVDLKIFE